MSGDNKEQNITSTQPKQQQLQATASFQETKTSAFGDIHDGLVLTPTIPVALRKSIGKIGNSEQNTISTTTEQQMQQTASSEESKTEIFSFGEFCDPILLSSIPVPPEEESSSRGNVSHSDNKEQNTVPSKSQQNLQPTATHQNSETSFGEVCDLVLAPSIPVPPKRKSTSLNHNNNNEQNIISCIQEQQLQTTASHQNSEPAFGEICDLVFTPSIPVPPEKQSTSSGNVSRSDNVEQNIALSKPKQKLQSTASHQNSKTSFGEICDPVLSPSIPVPREGKSTSINPSDIIEKNITSTKVEPKLQPTATHQNPEPAFGEIRDLVLAPSIPVPFEEDSTRSSGKVKRRSLWFCCARKKPNLASYAQPYGTWRKIKMASDNRAGSISKSVQKHAGRAKERILQNLGKADRTTDDILNIYISNFNKQHASAQRLSKEFKNYVSCARAMQAASKSLMDTLTDTYEQNWAGYDQLPAKTQVLEMVWDDFCHKLNDQVGVPIATYLSQFPEIRGKIAKRGRKLVDYDKCRHNLQSLQQPARKREEMKIGKAKERLDEARKLYEVINNELHDELPALYDSRISFLATNLQTMFVSENQFHSETAKVSNQFTDIVENLAMENQKGKYRLRKPGSPLILKGDGDTRHYEEIEFKRNQGRISGQNLSNGEIIPSNTLTRSDPKMREINLTVSSQTNTMNENSSLDQLRLPRKMEKDYEPVEVNDMNQSDPRDLQKMDELYDIPVGATTTDLPAGVLYRVRATYKYTGEDVDELSFEIGDIIQVVEYDDPEEQEEGWLMGTKESTGDKGLFPANFTRPI
ncbi:hypothetical protein JTE90_010948 [Oedothorax gibbosus]|uniref:Endophilin-A n=1 Tax=Oedothorax gibbosus TaxID=931172 RepID=A0AAV6UB00_9ARAC|nr:hypothetical protein JTE90_010948 [Oedothorax gibbosus]